MKIVDMMEKVFQMRKFKDRIKVINKSFPNFSDVVGKRGRILGVVIFIFDMLAMYLLSLYSGEPIYETKECVGTPGLCIFG